MSFQQTAEKISPAGSDISVIEDGASQAVNWEAIEVFTARDETLIQTALRSPSIITHLEDEVTRLRRVERVLLGRRGARFQRVNDTEVQRMINDVVTRGGEMNETIRVLHEASGRKAEAQRAAFETQSVADIVATQIRMADIQHADAMVDARNFLHEAKRRVVEAQNEYDEAHRVVTDTIGSICAMTRTQSLALSTLIRRMSGAGQQHFNSRAQFVQVEVTKDQVGKCYSFLYTCHRAHQRGFYN